MLKLFQTKGHFNNRYYNDLLHFSIEKPDKWKFVPQRWVRQFDAKHNHSKEFCELLTTRVVPFVSFCYRHNNKEIPYPTVLCACRVNNLSGQSRQEQLDEVIAEITQPFTGHKILKADPDIEIDGRPTMEVKFRFSVPSRRKQPIQCLNHTILVQQKEFLVIISLSSSWLTEFRYEAEFERILQSIKFGAAR